MIDTVFVKATTANTHPFAVEYDLAGILRAIRPSLGFNGIDPRGVNYDVVNIGFPTREIMQQQCAIGAQAFKEKPNALFTRCAITIERNVPPGTRYGFPEIGDFRSAIS